MKTRVRKPKAKPNQRWIAGCLCEVVDGWIVAAWNGPLGLHWEAAS